MSKVLRFASWLVLALVILLLALLLVIRFSPSTVVWGANQALKDMEVATQGLEIGYFPPRIKAASVSMRSPDQNIKAVTIDAAANIAQWYGGAAFWHANAERVEIVPLGTQLPDTDSAPPINLALPDLSPLFTFTRLRVGDLTIGGPTELTATLEANRESADSRIQAELRQAGSRYILTGTIRSSADQPMGIDLKVETTPVPADPASASMMATLKGTLATGAGGTQLAINSGGADITQGELTRSLTNLLGTFDIPESGHRLTLTNVSANLSSPGDQIENLPVALSGWVNFGAATTELDLQGELDKTTFAATAAINSGDASVQGEIRLDSEGLPASIQTSPFTEAQLFPATLSTNFSLTAASVRLSSFSLDTPTNKLTASAEATTASPWRLIADIQADEIYLPLISDSDSAGITPQDPAPDTATATAADRLFTTQPVDWSWLASAEVDVKLSAKQFSLQDAKFSDLQLAIANSDATLTLDPMRASIDDGGFSGTASITLLDTQSAQADGEAGAADITKTALPETVAETTPTQSNSVAALAPVALRADFAMHGVSLERFGLVPAEELSGGKIEADVELVSDGNSIAELASGLNGEILLMVEEATLMNDFIELAGSDLLMETLNKLNPFAKDDPTTQLSCALVRFTASDGRLETKNQLVMETSKMEIVGTGNINLNDETISLGITPNAKSGVGVNVGSAVKFMKLGGTLSSPRPAVSAGGLLKSGLAIGAAISTGGASVVAEGLAKRALNAGSACAAARSDRAKGSPPQTTATGEQ